jgi:hypothetical protein
VTVVSHSHAKLVFMTNQPYRHEEGRDRESRQIPHAAGEGAGGCCCGRCGRETRPPFGLPVLEEVPELAGLLEDLAAVDRTIARIIDVLILCEDTSLSENTTGLPLERWLAALAGRTRSDRRMLATAAQACRRLPGVHEAFRAGRLSWAQLRALSLRLQRLPHQHDEAIDAELLQALGLAGERPDPDSLLCVVSLVLDAYERPATGEERPEGIPDVDFLAMQPRLDGTGGTLYGDFGPDGFAAIDNRLAPDTPESGSREGFGADSDTDAGETTGRQLARSRARKLIELCTTRPGDGGRVPVPASYVVRVDVETLLRLSPDRAASLLTTMTGGAMWLDADTARTLADRHGTTLRLVLHDQGRVVGIGRRSEKVPGWLAEATLAIHDTCTEPGCTVAARACDLDHARPWADRDRPGRTDIDQLAPLCATANHDKEPAGWTVTQQPDGVRVWTHARTGLTTTTLPATWQPPPRAPGTTHPGSDPDGSDPPDGDRPGADRATGGTDPPRAGPVAHTQTGRHPGVDPGHTDHHPDHRPPT